MAKYTDNQIKAIETTGKNIIVSAGAGSGKTAVLTERVFRHVSIDKWDIDKMLVLTFTNAASLEMKQRIRNKLQVNENNLLSDEERLTQLNKLDSSYIMTFDAYALSLIKKYHYVLDLDNKVNLINDNVLSIKTDEILNDILNEEYKKKDAKFIRLINEQCVKDDRDIKEAIKMINDKLSLMYDREDYVSNYESNIFSNEALDNQVKAYADNIKSKVKKLEKTIDEFSKHVNDYHVYYPSIDELFNAESYEDIKTILEGFNSVPNISKEDSSEDSKSLKKEATDALKELKELTSVSLKDIKELILLSKDNSIVLINLANELNDRLYEYKRLNSLYSYNDIFKFAIRLVKENNDIKDEIKAYFKEILIDEYQDTSDLQDLFISSIEDNNVFMVGDIKQSIYQFRNANPSLFLNKYLSYEKGEGGNAINLQENFRSRSEVLEGIDNIFDRLMDINLGGADYKKKHHMIAGRLAFSKLGEWLNKHDNHIDLLTYEYNSDSKKEYPFNEFSKDEVEAFTVANDIKNKIEAGYEVADTDLNGNHILRKATYSDFSIIIDRKRNFDLYKEVLTYFNIPSIIISEERMNDSDLITVIKAIFKYLTCLNNADLGYEFKHSFLSISRSFIYEDKDSNIFNIIKEDKILNSDLANKLNRIYENIEYKSISNILDDIINEFDIYTKINKIGEVNSNFIKIDYLYELAHELSNIGYSYKDFSNYLDNSLDNDDKDIEYNIEKSDENAVKIINIHKSKGLEFPICYYPSISTEFSRIDLNSKFNFSRSLGVILPSFVEGKGLVNSIKKDIFKHELLSNEIGERIRVLYVALTRAKEKIIIVGPINDNSINGNGVIDEESRSSAKSFNDLLSLVYSDISKYRKDINFINIGLSKMYQYPSRDIFKVLNKKGDLIKLKESKVINPSLINETSFSKETGLINAKQLDNMELGTKVHYFLEVLDFINPNYDLVDKKYVAYIKDFLSSDLLKDVGSAKVYKEYEFIYDENNNKKHGIIDLLLEYDDKFVIIDYKTKNIDDELYDKQLNGYKKYIESISSKPAECYLYSIVDKKYRKIT